jgi:hypothetical protein
MMLRLKNIFIANEKEILWINTFFNLLFASKRQDDAAALSQVQPLSSALHAPFCSSAFFCFLTG